MQSALIIECFNILENAGPCILSSIVCMKIDVFGFKRMEKALGNGIVIAATGTSHT